LRRKRAGAGFQLGLNSAARWFSAASPALAKGAQRLISRPAPTMW
jgi:hypothetical protein